MQDKNYLQIANHAATEGALSKQRLSRFSLGGIIDSKKSIELYLWNCRLCAEFIISLHFAEVVTRNSIQKALHVRIKNPWFEDEVFLRLLDQKQKEHLESVINNERAQHKNSMSDDHVVSSLNFGFWDHLTTKRFDRLLWLRGIKHNFPNAFSKGLTIRDINRKIQTVRQWRNRIAHHRAIFDMEPERKFDETIELIGFACADTADMVKTNSRVLEVLASPPFKL